MRRSVARRIKAGLIAFTIVDAGVLLLGVERLHSAPRSVLGNNELAMQQFTLPPLFNSVPTGAGKQDAATVTGYATPPVVPVRSLGEGTVAEPEPVPAALLAAVPVHEQPPVQSPATHAGRHSHAGYAHHAAPAWHSGAVPQPFSSAFDGASSSAPPNPYYLPDASPAAPDAQAAPAASGNSADAALDATATPVTPPAADMAAAPVTHGQASPQAELPPSASVSTNPDVSAAMPPALPAGDPSPAAPATP